MVFLSPCRLNQLIGRSKHLDLQIYIGKANEMTKSWLSQNLAVIYLTVMH